MRVYLLQEADFERLFDVLDRDPASPETAEYVSLSAEDRAIFRRAYRWYSYKLRNWAEGVRGER